MSNGVGTIIHAQELLNVDDESPPPITPEPGDDILRLTEHGEYTAVGKQAYCEDTCDDCPHGPSRYHVIQERHPDGTETPYWKFIGKAHLHDE